MVLALLEGLLTGAWVLVEYATLPGAPAGVVQPLKEDRHARYDAELGWAHVPGARIANLYGPGLNLSVNNDGFRGLEDYKGLKPPNRFRLACVGDSFMLGHGVDDAQTIPAWIQRSNPRVQAVNLGQGGYSVGQCYLWVQRELPGLEADGWLLAIIPDDIWRLNSGRTESGYARPFFTLEGESLQLSASPLPPPLPAGESLAAEGGLAKVLRETSAIGRTAHRWTRPLRQARRSKPELIGVCLAILRALARRLRQLEVPFAVALYPQLTHLWHQDSMQVYRRVDVALQECAKQEGIPYLDLRPHFNPGHASSYYLEGRLRHFTANTNRAVAARLDAFLKESMPGYPR